MTQARRLTLVFLCIALTIAIHGPDARRVFGYPRGITRVTVDYGGRVVQASPTAVKQPGSV